MSRKINFTEPLNIEDLFYVQQRPWLIAVAKRCNVLDKSFDVSTEIDRFFAKKENRPVKGPEPSELPDIPKSILSDEPEDVDEDDDDPAYEQWGIADLKAEMRERGLPYPAKSSEADLAAKLRKDDGN
jgi:hypothetical protein